ncbi:hypothetical protein WOLCODRAFT_20186 [Wolfiporia cocos MD-104 SS10]|uniref:Uncharacterized protein n=1 Tax=Wolfiporia cocos (strain MD-104) TaxID=742152 RepID=A0A2H3JAQ3_WOLCO|nr:hypothetical protein WOLCODRAFT_20186 [Wolfiporia cocos MD-104 SS10]
MSNGKLDRVIHLYCCMKSATQATIEPETYLKPTPIGSTAAGSEWAALMKSFTCTSLKKIRKVIADEESDGGDKIAVVATAAPEAAADTTEITAHNADVPVQANEQANLLRQPVVETTNPLPDLTDLTSEEPQVPAFCEGKLGDHSRDQTL